MNLSALVRPRSIHLSTIHDIGSVFLSSVCRPADLIYCALIKIVLDTIYLPQFIDQQLLLCARKKSAPLILLCGFDITHILHIDCF